MSKEHGNLLDALTMMVIGVSGQGKSSFANLFLDGSFFKADDTAFPVTRDPEIKMSTIDNVPRYSIDTEGFYDGFTRSSDQIKKLIKTINDHKKGVNGIAIVVNGALPRFSQNVKDMIKFLYDLYFDETDEILNHISIVFTHCTETVPDRKLRRSDYANYVKQYIFEISGKMIDNIPMFFVDSLSPNKGFTKDEMIAFNSWISTLKPLMKLNEGAVLGGTRTVEIKKNKFVRSETVKVDENTEQTYSIFSTKRRFVWTPNNLEDPTYSDWVELDSRRILVETKMIEKQFNVDIGGNQKADRHQVIVKNEITGEVTTSGWINDVVHDVVTVREVEYKKRRSLWMKFRRETGKGLRKIGKIFR